MTLYDMNLGTCNENLLTDLRLFGITCFGDGLTIKPVTMVNALAYVLNNPFALIDVLLIRTL